jgi:hypothetical protein
MDMRDINSLKAFDHFIYLLLGLEMVVELAVGTFRTVQED